MSYLTPGSRLDICALSLFLSELEGTWLPRTWFTIQKLRLPLICAEKCGWFNDKRYKGKFIKSDDDVCGCTRCS